MNDNYWVVQENCKDLFKDKNLYHNSFNTNIASIAFTGYGSYTRTSFRSSPEFTTNGMLAKSWRRIKNNIFLYKMHFIHSKLLICKYLFIISF